MKTLNDNRFGTSRLRTNIDRSNYQLEIARSRSELTSRNSPVSAKASAQEGPATPQTGDVFGIYFPEKARIAHVGFIDQWDGTWLTGAIFTSTWLM